jgi:cytochrome c5
MRPPASTTTFQRIQKWAIGLGLALGLVVTATCQTAATNSSSVDYQRARMDPIHFKPAIDSATDKQCLACHAEVLKPSVRSESIAGVKASEAKAWYQDTSTYKGAQDTFHRRHLSTEFATKVMQMRCTTCHEGSSPRDEAPNTSASNQNQAPGTAKNGQPGNQLPEVPREIRP